LSQGSGSTSTKQKKAEAKAKKAKGGKKSTTDHLLDLSKSFDKGLPKPKSRAEEKQQKAEQLANLLRIQKELTSDYKVGVACRLRVAGHGRVRCCCVIVWSWLRDDMPGRTCGAACCLVVCVLA